MATIINAPVKAAGTVTYPKLRVILDSLQFTFDSLITGSITASRAVVTDSSGLLTTATTTATEIGYVNGVTSSIQTQLNTKYTDGSRIKASNGTASAPGITFDDGTSDAGLYRYLSGGRIVFGTAVEGHQTIEFARTGSTFYGTCSIQAETVTSSAAKLNFFSPTSSKGTLSFQAADSAGNTETLITNASQAGARTYTIPDAGASASFVMTEGSATVNGAKTFGSAIAITPTTNQLVLGSTRTVTITAPTPASSSRTITFPDLSADYSVVGTEGAQTINGAKSLTSVLNVTVNNSTTNDVTEVLSLGHNTTGTPANGIGTEIDFYAETSTTPDSRLSTIGSTWTDVTHATRTSKIYFQTRNSGTLATTLEISGDGDVYSTAYTDYSSSSTVTGWSTPTKKIYYKRIGKLVYVWFQISGTSNATTASFTLPYTTANTVDFAVGGYSLDNTATTPGVAYIAANTTTVNLYPNSNLGNWTNSGTKRFYAHFVYQST